MLDLYRFQQTKPPPGAMIDLSHPLSRGLVAAWLFNEGAGGAAFSSAPLDQDGTFCTKGAANAAVWTKGGFNVITGANVAILDGAAPKRTTRLFSQMSLAVRGNFSASPTFGCFLVVRGAADAFWAPLSCSSNTLTNAWANSASTYSGTSAATIPLNVPNTFMAGASDNKRGLFYANGKYGTTDYSGSLLKTSLTWDSALHLCRDSGGSTRTITGVYDFMYFWLDRKLTLDDFRSIEANPYQMFLPTNPNRMWFLPGATAPRQNLMLLGVG